jgi:hypothetical protein
MGAWLDRGFEVDAGWIVLEKERGTGLYVGSMMDTQPSK